LIRSLVAPLARLGVFLLASLLALGWPAAAAAQTPARLASLHVSLWPEYDRPQTLVILEGELAPEVALPASLSIRIPARAGQPHAVASTGADGQLLSAAFTTRPNGDDIMVDFQTPSPTFRVEYYDPALTIDGEARSLIFEWQTDYAVDEVRVRVQQPAGARDLTGQPALISLGMSDDGLTYYEATPSSLKPGDRLSKTGSGLSVDTLSNTTSPQPEAVAPRPAADNRPWLIGGAALGVVVIGAGALVYARTRRPVPARATRRPRRRPAPAAAAAHAAPVAPGVAGGARFCTACGQPRQPGDRFCRNCGADLAGT
jgi:hypothetical protein